MSTSEKPTVYKSVHDDGFKKRYPVVYKVFAGDKKPYSPGVQLAFEAYLRRKNAIREN